MTERLVVSLVILGAGIALGLCIGFMQAPDIRRYTNKPYCEEAWAINQKLKRCLVAVPLEDADR